MNNILNFIICLFIKPNLIIYNDYFEYKKNKYFFRDIIEMEFYPGSSSRFTYDPCALILYREGQPGIEITHPSLIMVLLMKKRLRHLKLKINGTKNLIFYVLLMIGVALILGVVKVINN